MSYVDAIYDRRKDVIQVVERNKNKERVYIEYPVNHTFYYEDMNGNYRTLWGTPCKKFSTTKKGEFKRKLDEMKSRNKIIHESDLNPIFRCLSENYLNDEPPELNIGFFDIETDFHETKGFADQWEPFNRITAITIYKTFDDINYTMVLKPDLKKDHPNYMSYDEAQDIVDSFDNTVLYDSEEDMLNAFYELISDVDMLVGWNSNVYDIPYIVNRTRLILGEEATRKICLWNMKPRIKEGKDKWGKPTKIYETFGIVHLDFLEVYKKQNGKELPSFSLDFVSELELGDRKVEYDGTLDDLYKKDFKKFIEYSRQDVMLMVRLEIKKKYIALANQLAHMNTVNIQKTMGSVAIIEQGIINEAHRRGMAVPSKKIIIENDYDEDEAEDDDEDEKAAVGAFVREPIPGIYKMIACCDINSLYPSTLRSLNIGPETILGQIRQDRTEEWVSKRLAMGIKPKDVWVGTFAAIEYDLVMNKSEEIINIDYEDGTSETMKACELYDIIFTNKSQITLSANGTLFRKDVEAVIPGLLGIWYSERKQMQGKEKLWGQLKDGIVLKHDDIEYDIDKTVSCEFDIDKFIKSIKRNEQGQFEIIDIEYINNIIKSGIIIYDQSKFKFHDEDKAEYEKGFWNQRQQARKILLNSLYGAILNEGFRMYDQRMGQSVTLTGRSITKHMSAKVNELIEGTYDVEGRSIVYNDTDSVYFTASLLLEEMGENGKELIQNIDYMIDLYDQVADKTNESFAPFMDDYFNTGLERGAIIKAGRELVASVGYFIKKKKYALMVIDDEGKRLDVDGKPGKLKITGLDIKRSDTPKFIQEFLKELLMDLLYGKTKKQIYDKILDFRDVFRNMKPWEKSVPKKVNNISGYEEKIDANSNVDVFNKRKQTKKVNLPGNVAAAMNWNKIIKLKNDNTVPEIKDGARIRTLPLKKNSYGMNTIAYPLELENTLPSWFKKLPFDTILLENICIDKKLTNLFGCLEWDLEKTKKSTAVNDFFDF